MTLTSGLGDRQIVLTAPTRLHFGLLNLSDAGYRIDGGCGLLLERPSVRVTISSSKTLIVEPPCWFDVIADCLGRVGLAEADLCVNVDTKVPSHSGLGLGTQLRLATTVGALTLLGRSIPGAALAPLVGRGGTSGVGSWGFWMGGFVVDAGHLRSAKISALPTSMVNDPSLSPLILQQPFPWTTVVAIARDMDPVFGALEASLFRSLTPTPRIDALRAYEVLLSQVIPSISGGDLDGLDVAMRELREIGFKRREIAYRGHSAVRALGEFDDAGLLGGSMSSWGPAFFGFAPSAEAASRAEAALRSSGVFSDVWASESSRSGATVQLDGTFRSVATSRSMLASREE